MSEPFTDPATVDGEAVPATVAGGSSLRGALVGALARAGLGGAAMALAAWLLQQSGFALATGHGFPDAAARVLTLAA